MNLEYLVLGLALLFAVVAALKPNPYCLPVSVIMLACVAFSHVHK